MAVDDRPALPEEPEPADRPERADGVDSRSARRAARAEQQAARRAAAEQRSADRAAARSARRSAKDSLGDRDPFVEAPRAPRASGAERLRTVRSVAAGVLGATGLLCSVLLALGALLLALGAGEGSDGVEAIFTVCDALIGPLRDAFSFAGSEAAKKESLAAWGVGSVGYLVVSLLVQRYLPPHPQD